MIKKIIENIITAEARACTRKQFKAASELFKLFLSTIIGIKARRLISNPIHKPNHEFAEITINDPSQIININRILDKLLKI